MPTKTAASKVTKKTTTKVKKTTKSASKAKPEKKKTTKVVHSIAAKKVERSAPKEQPDSTKKQTKKRLTYIFAVGRRKSAVARVRFYKDGAGEITVNDKSLNEYFQYFQFQNIVLEPLKLTGKEKEGHYTIKVTGGGTRGQADSIRLGISRILLLMDKNIRPTLKAQKLLTRDPRVKERKKYGLKKARRAPQWQKR